MLISYVKLDHSLYSIKYGILILGAGCETSLGPSATCSCQLDYGGVLISGVIDKMGVWVITKINDVL